MIPPRGVKFAAIALENTHPSFERDILIQERYACTTTCPFTLDSGWQTWLGSIAVSSIIQEDFNMLLCESAEYAHPADLGLLVSRRCNVPEGSQLELHGVLHDLVRVRTCKVAPSKLLGCYLRQVPESPLT